MNSKTVIISLVNLFKFPIIFSLIPRRSIISDGEIHRLRDFQYLNIYESTQDKMFIPW